MKFREFFQLLQSQELNTTRENYVAYLNTQPKG